MENKVAYTFTRQEVESVIGKTLTDKEWEIMASALEDSLDTFFGEEVISLYEDIDQMIIEYDENADFIANYQG